MDEVDFAVLIQRMDASLDRNSGILERVDWTIAANEKTIAANERTIAANERLLEDNVLFLREMTLRTEKMTQSVERKGDRMIAMAEKQDRRTDDLIEESRAQRQALLAILDRLPGTGPSTA